MNGGSPADKPGSSLDGDDRPDHHHHEVDLGPPVGEPLLDVLPADVIGTERRRHPPDAIRGVTRDHLIESGAVDRVGVAVGEPADVAFCLGQHIGHAVPFPEWK